MLRKEEKGLWIKFLRFWILPFHAIGLKENKIMKRTVDKEKIPSKRTCCHYLYDKCGNKPSCKGFKSFLMEKFPSKKDIKNLKKIIFKFFGLGITFLKNKNVCYLQMFTHLLSACGGYASIRTSFGEAL